MGQGKQQDHKACHFGRRIRGHRCRAPPKAVSWARVQDDADGSYPLPGQELVQNANMHTRMAYEIMWKFRAPSLRKRSWLHGTFFFHTYEKNIVDGRSSYLTSSKFLVASGHRGLHHGWSACGHHGPDSPRSFWSNNACCTELWHHWTPLSVHARLCLCMSSKHGLLLLGLLFMNCSHCHCHCCRCVVVVAAVVVVGGGGVVIAVAVSAAAAAVHAYGLLLSTHGLLLFMHGLLLSTHGLLLFTHGCA